MIQVGYMFKQNHFFPAVLLEVFNMNDEPLPFSHLIESPHHRAEEKTALNLVALLLVLSTEHSLADFCTSLCDHVSQCTSCEYPSVSGS